jgi:hypothetical protein
MTKEQAATAIRLATAARPTHEDDDCSERQISAAHDFWSCLEFHGLDLEDMAQKLSRHDTDTAIDCGLLWIADSLDGKKSSYLSPNEIALDGDEILCQLAIRAPDFETAINLVNQATPEGEEQRLESMGYETVAEFLAGDQGTVQWDGFWAGFNTMWGADDYQKPLAMRMYIAKQRTGGSWEDQESYAETHPNATIAELIAAPDPHKMTTAELDAEYILWHDLNSQYSINVIEQKKATDRTLKENDLLRWIYYYNDRFERAQERELAE